MKHVLLVEDDATIAKSIKMNINSIQGCKVTVVAESNGAIQLLQKQKFDLVIIDTSLKDKTFDGIDLAHQINYYWEVPIVFLVDTGDESCAERMNVTSFLLVVEKSGDNDDFKNAIILAFNQYSSQKNQNIVIKSMGGLSKLLIKDIVYILASGSRCIIFYRSDNEITHTVSMKSFVDSINKESFVKTHRSCTVNIAHIESVVGNEIVLNFKGASWRVPLSNRHKDILISKWIKY